MVVRRRAGSCTPPPRWRPLHGEPSASRHDAHPADSFAPTASAILARETFDPPPLPPIALLAPKTAPPNGGARKRRMVLIFLLTMGLGGLYLMQSARAGAPDCGAADATRLLRETLRDKLARQKVPARQIEFAEIAAMTPDEDGVDKCRAVLMVDGQPAANLVYRLSLKLRLVVYNRYALELLSETPI
jgi:hypothetical protein